MKLTAAQKRMINEVIDNGQVDTTRRGWTNTYDALHRFGLIAADSTGHHSVTDEARALVGR